MLLRSCAKAAAVARSRPVRCSSSVVEHPLGKGEAESSILSCSTTYLPDFIEKNTGSRAEHSLFPKEQNAIIPQDSPANLGKIRGRDSRLVLLEGRL